jgi:hypothetical protein
MNEPMRMPVEAPGGVRGWTRNEIETFRETDDREVRIEGGKGC